MTVRHFWMIYCKEAFVTAIKIRMSVSWRGSTDFVNGNKL